jgi:hypothetical protein
MGGFWMKKWNGPKQFSPISKWKKLMTSLKGC